MVRRRSRVLISVALFLVLAQARAADRKDQGAAAIADHSGAPLRFVTGPDVETGTYGTPRHSTVSSWNSTVDWTPWDSTTLSINLPYLVQRAPAGTIAGRALVSHRPHLGVGREVTTDGIGDVSIGADQELLEQSDSTPIDIGVSALVETPTASVSKGLGSGKPNFTGQMNVARTFGKLYGEVQGGYSVVGSPGRVSVNGVKEVVKYQNIWLGSATGSYQLAPHWFAGGTFEAERS